MPVVKKLPPIPKTVDDLGKVKADIATLETQEKKLVTILKGQGVNVYEGTLFNATVFKQERNKVTNWEAIAQELKADKETIRRHTVTRTIVNVDWAAIAEEFEPDVKLIAKHTTSDEVVVCKVTAR